MVDFTNMQGISLIISYNLPILRVGGSSPSNFNNTGAQITKYYTKFYSHTGIYNNTRVNYNKLKEITNLEGKLLILKVNPFILLKMLYLAHFHREI